METVMKITTLEDLLVDELKDLYSAEGQLVKALPKIAKGVDSEDLQLVFEEHLRQTHKHVERLELICQKLDINPKGKKCLGMEGLLAEGMEILNNKGESEPLEAGMIGAAQRVEHYEIAAYGTARAHARQLGFTEIADLLDQTLTEEKQANDKLTYIAENKINVQAAMSDSREAMNVKM
jgi:ferritin-like metal-binding protein YciE